MYIQYKTCNFVSERKCGHILGMCEFTPVIWRLHAETCYACLHVVAKQRQNNRSLQEYYNSIFITNSCCVLWGSLIIKFLWVLNEQNNCSSIFFWRDTWSLDSHSAHNLISQSLVWLNLIWYVKLLTELSN